MGILVSDIRKAVKRACNGIGDEDFYLLLNEAHARICKRVQLYPQASAFITWTVADIDSERGEWPAPAGVRRGWQARYWSDADTSYELTATNIHRLDNLNGDWRVEDPSQPNEWYFSGGNIGLYPKPSSDPSSGYPKVELYCTGFEELDEYGMLPDFVDDMSAWEYYIKWKYLNDRDDGKRSQKIRDYYSLHRTALRELAIDVAAIVPRDYMEVHSAVPQVVNI